MFEKSTASSAAWQLVQALQAVLHGMFRKALQAVLQGMFEKALEAVLHGHDYTRYVGRAPGGQYSRMNRPGELRHFLPVLPKTCESAN